MTAEDFSTMNLAEQMSQIDTMPPSDVPPREGLYSTPLSWEKPQPGLRLDSLLSTQDPHQLNEEDQRRLIAIAMNTGPVMGGLGSGQFGGLGNNNRGYISGSGLHATLASGLSLGGLGGMGNMGHMGGMGGMGPMGGMGAYSGGLGGLGMGQMTDDAPLLRPETPAVAKPPQLSRPRLSRTNTDRSATEDKGKGKETETEDGGKVKPGDRTAHNDIERKYRTNLKDRIAELRDAVPALRTIEDGVPEEGDSSTPASRPKVSKVSDGDFTSCHSPPWGDGSTSWCQTDSLQSGTGYGAHESNRVHQLPGKEEQVHHSAASATLQATCGIRAAPQPDGEAVIPDAQLQSHAVRPQSFLLIHAVSCLVLSAFFFYGTCLGQLGFRRYFG